VRTVGLRVPSQLWKSITWYGTTAGIVRPDGEIDISETLRDLLARGLNSDRSSEQGYRNGYTAGRSAAYADFMRRVGAATRNAK
jgi:hypothetical protein